MRQKLLILLTALTTAISSYAYDDFEVDGIHYNILSSSEVEVDYIPSGYSGELIIPASVSYRYTTYSVTSIDVNAFVNQYNLTSVIIPESVTRINRGAFKGCTGLTSVTIPESVTFIDEGAFEGCTGLTSVTIPESVRYISDEVFSGCSGLTSVNLPESVWKIGESAFEDCSGLTSVTLPESLKYIGNYAFVGCTGLTSVTIPESATDIGMGAFAWCDNLTSFLGKHVSEDNRCIILDGVLVAFAPAGLVSYSIPNSVTSIGGYAFAGCSGLTSVTIPESLTYIGMAAFGGCEDLSSFQGKHVSEDNRCIIIDGVLVAFAPAGLVSYTLPNSVISIGDFAFWGCSGQISMTIPDSVTSIGDYAFAAFVGLTSVTLPNSLTSISNYAFAWSNLTSVTIPSSVTSIGVYAFEECSSLTSVTIPESVTYILFGAFSYCSSLTSVTVENPDPSAIKLENSVFYGVPTSTCILYVPNGSEKLYRRAPQWRDFYNIEESTSGIENVYPNDILYDKDEYYDLMGRRVEYPTPGLYIHNGRKVFIK